MTSDRWSRVADLFDRAADLAPADRAAFLDREALGPGGQTDGALREEVERLLAADRDDAFLDDPVGPDLDAPPPDAGPWRLVERVGQGGMGEVWRAQRSGGFEQTAAIKLVRPGLGDTLVARFRAERQILAGLEHPAIARLLDGGTASDGRPYLATEFVEGEPVTAYCDRRRLGVNERLAVFAEVCDAVAYAHTRLVVHRDLKPSNVMVTPPGPSQAARLRDRQAARRRRDADPDRQAVADAGLRRARAGRRRAGHDGDRRLRPGRPALRTPDGRPPARRRRDPAERRRHDPGDDRGPGPDGPRRARGGHGRAPLDDGRPPPTAPPGRPRPGRAQGAPVRPRPALPGGGRVRRRRPAPPGRLAH